MTTCGNPDPAELDKLATELAGRGFQTSLIVTAGRRPSLMVTNPEVLALSETVIAEEDWFWWPWADRIRPVTDVVGAADAIAKVLATAVGGGRS